MSEFKTIETENISSKQTQILYPQRTIFDIVIFKGKDKELTLRSCPADDDIWYCLEIGNRNENYDTCYIKYAVEDYNSGEFLSEMWEEDE